MENTMRATANVILTATLLLTACNAAYAGSLQVEPVLLDVTAPGAASTLTLRNDGTKPVSAQIRVFRWSIVNGKEELKPTNDVVASPPVETLAPQRKYVVRIVRVTKRPVVGEESYRLLVDQLPNLSQQRNGAINLLVRYSIPVFFGTADKQNPKITWSVARRGNKVIVTANNSGERRLRISALRLRDANGKTLSFGPGLTGYALGRSTISWTKPAHAFAAKGFATIYAQTDKGPLRAGASVSAAR